MKINLIKDGNFSTVVIYILLIVGLAFILIPVEFIYPPNVIGLFFMIMGFLMTIIAGYSARAKMLGIKPFGGGNYKKARESYRDIDHE